MPQDKVIDVAKTSEHRWGPSIPPSRPARHMSGIDAVSIILGAVIGAGIFKAPQLVAANTSGGGMMMLAWIGGAAFCLCGALSYAELSSAYPHSGGEYVFLSRSFGRLPGFLFVWGRMAIIQTGSIAALAYIFGDYAAAIVPLGKAAAPLYAFVAVVVLTVLNVTGLRVGKGAQNLLTAAKMLGVVGIGVAAALAAPGDTGGTGAASAPAGAGSFGLAMVFVLYTYGGWNEAAYIAGEVRHARRRMLGVLVASVVILALLYVAVNAAYLRILGTEGMRNSSAVAADAMAAVLGPRGRLIVGALVAISALGAMNACIFTGARSMWAAGVDHGVFGALGHWHQRRQTPVNALLVQGSVALLLVLFAAVGEGYRAGFATAVEYTAPVFWLFLTLTGMAVFVLRVRNKGRGQTFRVPFGLVIVPLFCLTCGYMLYSSLMYTGAGALVGVAVLAVGLPLYALRRRPCDGLERPAD